MSPEEHDYLARDARARVEIDKQLTAAGWSVQNQTALITESNLESFLGARFLESVAATTAFQGPKPP